MVTIVQEPIEEFEIIHRNYLEVITLNVDWDTEEIRVYDEINQLQTLPNYCSKLPQWFKDLLDYWDTEFLSLIANMKLWEAFSPKQYNIVTIKRTY